jgi:hypothetical protein
MYRNQIYLLANFKELLELVKPGWIMLSLYNFFRVNSTFRPYVLITGNLPVKVIMESTSVRMVINLFTEKELSNEIF